MQGRGYFSSSDNYTCEKQTLSYLLASFCHTLWNEHINVLMHRQKGSSLKLLLANCGIFRLSLIETLRFFWHISIASNNVCLHCRIGYDKANPSKLNICIFAKPTQLYPRSFYINLEEELKLWGVWKDHKRLCNVLSCTILRLLYKEKCVYQRSLLPPPSPSTLQPIGRFLVSPLGRNSELERECLFQLLVESNTFIRKSSSFT